MNTNELDFAPHRAQLLAYATRAVGDMGEDLVQETFIKAIRFAHTFDGVNLGGWLMSILKTRITDYYNYNKARPQTQDLAQYSDEDSNDMADIADPNEQHEDESAPMQDENYNFGVFGSLQPLVDKLSHEHQQILFLTHVTGLSDKECAEVLGIALATTRTRRLRANAQLRALVEEVGA